MVLAAVAALLALPAPASAGEPTGRLLVTLDEAPQGRARAASRAVVAAAAALGARSAGPAVPQIGLVTLRADAGRSPAAVARALRALPGVASVQREERAQLRYMPNDPALSSPEPAAGAPPGTTLEWWAPRQGLPTAWDVTRGTDAVVAVIDTGIDAAHPEFAGRIISSTDHDDTPARGPATVDEIGHGTHVASLACAAGDNGLGLAGAGLDCRLLIAKTDLSDSSIARSIVWAVDRGADAINMSFGTDGSRAASDALVRAVDYAYGRGVVLVAAAADDAVEEQGDPANVLQPSGSGPEITEGKGLTITAANYSDQRATFAGFGSQITMAAYGAFQLPNGPRGILGAFPGNPTQIESGALLPQPTPPCNCRTQVNGDARYAYLQGTSMAAPVVAATAAMIRAANTDIGAREIIRLLKDTARRPLGSDWEPNLGWGILDAGNALLKARRVDVRPPRSRLTAPRRPASTRVRLRWSADDPAPANLIPSGVARFEVWRSANRRGFRKLRTTRSRSLTVNLRPGSSYAFYTVAVDKAGNREAPPKRADARVTVPRSARR